VNAVDVLIVVACLIGLFIGYSQGFWLTVARYTGMAAGIVLGIYFTPDIVRRFDITDPVWRQVTAALIIIVAGSVGGSLGFWLGHPLRRWLLDRRVLGTLDSLAGAALSLALTLALVWLLALVLARGPSPDLARAIQQSRIVSQLDEVAPEPPAWVAQIQQILSGRFLPPLFTGLEPSLPSREQPSPASADTAGVRAAAASTVKVQGVGCGGVATGSGFPVDDELIVTNAHVVSGTSRTTVSTRDGRSRPATVVVFDPDRDVAVLRAPGLNVEPLDQGEARAGTPGAVIGYPGGGPLTVSPAVVEGRITARGRDIYSEDIVTREIWTLSARVRPGNSGGPLVDEQGRWLGVVFAASLSAQNQAYALTADEIAPRIEQAATATQAINTRALPCSR
jgi:S1-C subfamily serine protease